MGTSTPCADCSGHLADSHRKHDLVWPDFLAKWGSQRCHSQEWPRMQGRLPYQMDRDGRMLENVRGLPREIGALLLDSLTRNWPLEKCLQFGNEHEKAVNNTILDCNGK
ncbi:unnamed protein product [Ostreobium quekettii]|uniref:Uncharacterized protein n=1 Tax=Ostreobium quekettii TaxID=121088 RepID=A0A8S1J086_9CHLO|nr:unnamed protein product [Ostreobium quekettii]